MGLTIIDRVRTAMGMYYRTTALFISQRIEAILVYIKEFRLYISLLLSLIGGYALWLVIPYDTSLPLVGYLADHAPRVSPYLRPTYLFVLFSLVFATVYVSLAQACNRVASCLSERRAPSTATPQQDRTDLSVYYEKTLGFVSDYRIFLSILIALAVGYVLWTIQPYDTNEPLLHYLDLYVPRVTPFLRWSYLFILFGNPFFLAYFLLSQVYIRAVQGREGLIYRPLPPYPSVESRTELSVVLGETHNHFDFERATAPQWCVLPESGLYTGIQIFGGIGGGKTSALMYPIVDQLVGFMSTLRDKRLSGIVLEVKGDFCHQVHSIMKRYNRADDYVEISMDPRYCYNPLFNNMDAYARAFQISSVMAQIFGKSSEPYWVIQSTALMKNIIRLYELADDYVTITDVLTAASNIDVLSRKLQATKKKLGSTVLFLVSESDFLDNVEALHKLHLPWEAVEIGADKWWQAPASQDLAEGLKKLGLYIWPRSTFATQRQRDCQFVNQEIERWAKEWQGYDPKLRSSIVSSVSGILSLFTDTPEASRVFCPPKEAYIRTGNETTTRSSGQPIPLPKFSTLIEQGKVIGVNFPTALNPSLSKILCTMIKADFQTAMLNRIPKMKDHTGNHFRPVFMLIDEYHLLCALGGNSNNGDEHFLSLSRQAKCIPILATQSITSLKTATGGQDTYKTLMQAVRTTINLATNDLDTAKYTADLIGKTDKLKTNVNLSESGQDATVSLLTGSTVSGKSSMSHSISYSTQKEYIFEPHEIVQLPNSVAVAVIYDGDRARSQALFAVPYYTSKEKTWHEKYGAGEIATRKSDIDKPTYTEPDEPFAAVPLTSNN
jgi:TraM recognition site of TraD and TraG